MVSYFENYIRLHLDGEPEGYTSNIIFNRNDIDFICKEFTSYTCKSFYKKGKYIKCSFSGDIISRIYTVYVTYI